MAARRVGVVGAAGRMGREVCEAVEQAADLDLVARVDVNDPSCSSGLDALLDAGAEVVVDFTVAAAARTTLAWCAERRLHAVVGTTGFDTDDLERLRAAYTGSSCLVAANFAIGAVLMMRFAELAAPWFETAEIIELHHDAKRDAPSGTSLATAARMSAASDAWAPDPTEGDASARGRRAGHVPIHSVRLRGLVAHQEVLLGTTGETLTIRHDSLDRASFMPGVLLAVRRVHERPGLTLGIEHLLGL